MAQGHFQRLEHSQRQILAPILQQNIQLMVLNTMDLLQEIHKKLDDNPFLEMESDNGRGQEIENLIATRVANEKVSEIPEDDFDSLKQDIYEDSNKFQFDKRISGPSDANSKQNFLENTITTSQSIYDHLKAQLKMHNFSADEAKIADVIISCIDEYGILRTSLEDIVTYSHSDMEEVEATLRKVQELDPPGVGARDTQEYILIQIEKLYGENSLIYRGVKLYFEVFQELEGGKDSEGLSDKKKKEALQQLQYNAQKMKKKAMQKVADKLKVRLEDVEAILKKVEENIQPAPIIDVLDEDDSFSYITPDIIVTVDPEDFSVDVKVFDDYLPKLRLNQEYKKHLRKERGVEVSENIQELKNKYEEAKSFVNLIQRRSSTLYNLTMHLVDIQREFFLKGTEFIKPLTIKEMAEILGVHESTVSRIVNNKYISTPFGVFPLKYLFSHRISGSSGDVSAKKVGELIKKIIENEGGKKKLSDSSIEKILKNMGVKISRRTVAKYRKKLNIHSSFER